MPRARQAKAGACEHCHKKEGHKCLDCGEKFDDVASTVAHQKRRQHYGGHYEFPKGQMSNPNSPRRVAAASADSRGAASSPSSARATSPKRRSSSPKRSSSASPVKRTYARGGAAAKRGASPKRRSASPGRAASKAQASPKRAVSSRSASPKRGAAAAGSKKKSLAPGPPAGEVVDPGPFCLCRGPDTGTPMVACDNCDEWYHMACIGIDRWHAARGDFVCDNCAKGEASKKSEEAAPARGRASTRGGATAASPSTSSNRASSKRASPKRASPKRASPKGAGSPKSSASSSRGRSQSPATAGKRGRSPAASPRRSARNAAKEESQKPTRRQRASPKKGAGRRSSSVATGPSQTSIGYGLLYAALQVIVVFHYLMPTYGTEDNFGGPAWKCALGSVFGPVFVAVLYLAYAHNGSLGEWRDRCVEAGGVPSDDVFSWVLILMLYIYLLADMVFIPDLRFELQAHHVMAIVANFLSHKMFWGGFPFFITGAAIMEAGSASMNAFALNSSSTDALMLYVVIMTISNGLTAPLVWRWSKLPELPSLFRYFWFFGSFILLYMRQKTAYDLYLEMGSDPHHAVNHS